MKEFLTATAFAALVVFSGQAVFADDRMPVVEEDSGGPLDWPLDEARMKIWQTQNGMVKPSACKTTVTQESTKG